MTDYECVMIALMVGDRWDWLLSVPGWLCQAVSLVVFSVGLAAAEASEYQW